MHRACVETLENRWLLSGYTNVFIPLPPDAFDSDVLAVNNSNQVIGHYTDSSFLQHAWLYNYTGNGDGELVDLGAMLADEFGAIVSSVVDINEAGQVIGTYRDSTLAEYGYLYSNGDLITLPLSGDITGVVALNDAGQVAGWGRDGMGRQVAYLYDSGQFTVVPPPDGVQPQEILAMRPTGLNADGDVIGWFVTSTDQYAFLYSDGQTTNLGALAAGRSSIAVDINEGGQVLGSTWTEDFSFYHGFIYDNNGITYIDPPTGYTDAVPLRINAAGDVIGWFDGLSSHAFIYSDGSITTLTLGGSFSEPKDFNDAGQVVGWSLDETDNLAGFLYDGGSLVALDFGLATTPVAINASGLVAGTFVADDGTHVFVYDGSLNDLGTLDGLFLDVVDINDAGAVIGMVSVNFSNQPFILVPTAAPADSQAPVVADLVVTPNPALAGDPMTFFATVSDAGTGDSTIQSAEYRIFNGTSYTDWLPMNAADGAFDSVTEIVTVQITAPGVGIYTIEVRGIDSSGNVSESTSALFGVDGRVHGAGTLDGPIPFNFDIRSDDLNITGNLQLRLVSSKMAFQSTSIDSLFVDGNTAYFTGQGTFNNQGGYWFEAMVVDGRSSGQKDEFRIRIWNDQGLVFSNYAEDGISDAGIKGGNIQIKD